MKKSLNYIKTSHLHQLHVLLRHYVTKWGFKCLYVGACYTVCLEVNLKS